MLPHVHGGVCPAIFPLPGDCLLGFTLLLAFSGFNIYPVMFRLRLVFKGLFSQHTKLANMILALLLVYCFILLFL